MNTVLSLLGIELVSVSFREKFVSIMGGFLSISILSYIAHATLDEGGTFCFVGSMGASAVLLFAVPHGQLSQPWPVLAGHGLSAAIGVLCARYFSHEWIASGVAVGLSIGVMHQLKCIHPPGGATALTAVIGGDAVRELGFHFIWYPVLISAVLMIVVAIIFNWPFVWRRYPSALSKRRFPLKPHPFGKENTHEDIVKALRALDSFVDITEADLIVLARMIAREREARILKEQRTKS